MGRIAIGFYGHAGRVNAGNQLQLLAQVATLCIGEIRRRGKKRLSSRFVSGPLGHDFGGAFGGDLVQCFLHDVAQNGPVFADGHVHIVDLEPNRKRRFQATNILLLSVIGHAGRIFDDRVRLAGDHHVHGVDD